MVQGFEQTEIEMVGTITVEEGFKWTEAELVNIIATKFDRRGMKSNEKGIHGHAECLMERVSGKINQYGE